MQRLMVMRQVSYERSPCDDVRVFINRFEHQDSLGEEATSSVEVDELGVKERVLELVGGSQVGMDLGCLCSASGSAQHCGHHHGAY